MTLAVGDGANDCSMISEADIGIGIKGNLYFNIKTFKGMKECKQFSLLILVLENFRFYII